MTLILRRKKKSASPNLREKTTHLKKGHGLKASSQRWVMRQMNDPYVHRARMDGYRSRAAYKLLEIQKKFLCLRKNQHIVDLGAAPGGWSQVILQHIGPRGCLIGIDLLPIDPLEGAHFLESDFTDSSTVKQLDDLMPQGAHGVISDMAANTTGHQMTDHLRTSHLARQAFDYAARVLRPGGFFITKVFQGGTDHALKQDLDRSFKTVRHMKPPASRKNSPEMYVVCLSFRKTHSI